jgi:virulence factor
MLINKIIDKYKSIRKQSYLNRPGSYQYQYAFVGTGQHAIANLYPCLDYLGVPLKWICSQSLENARKMALRYPGASGTNKLQDIVDDPAIRGVFVSVKAQVHYEMVKTLLQAGKAVFVEKPCCLTRPQLQDLAGLAAGKTCLVGLQRRYGALNQKLKARLKSRPAQTYNYRFITGALPEGDAVLEVFIHALDNIAYLFGATARVQVLQPPAARGSVTFMLLVLHTSGTSGVVELSTDYNWNQVQESLILNTRQEVLEAHYPYRLVAAKKSGRIGTIPLEKITRPAEALTVLYDSTGFLPVLENNTLWAQGFYQELETFVNLVEGKKAANVSTPASLLATYQLIEVLQQEKRPSS